MERDAPPTEEEMQSAKVRALKHLQSVGTRLTKEELGLLDTHDDDLDALHENKNKRVVLIREEDKPPGKTELTNKGKQNSIFKNLDHAIKGLNNPSKDGAKLDTDSEDLYN